MSIVSFDLLCEFLIEKTVLKSEFCVFLDELLNFTLVESRAGVVLEDRVLKLVASKVELRAHLGRLMGLSHD